MDDEKLQGTAETAEQTTLKASTLRYLRSRGQGPPYFKIGRRVVYRRGDVDAWIQSHRVETEQEA